MLLMCKDTVVYDTDTNFVYNYMLLPGLMKSNPCKETFKKWLKLRYSSNTNSLARELKGITFGQENRELIDKTTHILSLSDCYWVKDEKNNLHFNVVTPYDNDFWKGQGLYKNGYAIPTLYVNGYLSKEWVSSKYLYKYGSNLDIEVEVCNLCKVCDIPVCNIDVIQGGIRVENFTSMDFMLEQADQSGMLNPDDFTEKDIIDLMGISGVQMVTIDAITGNGDRHAGNFGWLRDTNNGAYVCSAPLYDFDHALDSKLSYDLLIRDAANAIQSFPDFIYEAIRICCIAVNDFNTNKVFKDRANTLFNLIKSS